MKKLVVKPDAEPIFFKLADKGVSAEEREKFVVILKLPQREYEKR